MSKPTAIATGLLLLAGLTGGCVLDASIMADLPSGTIMTGSGRSGGAIIVSDRDDDRIILPSRRGPVIVTAPARDTTPTAVSSDARNPVIQSFTANPGNFVEAGQPITFQVVAHDPGNQPLQYNWSSTGGTLSTTSGQLVIWNPPAKAGTYTVSTMISNGRGGATSGSQNLIVKADGSINVPTPVAVPVAPVAAPVAPAPAPQQAAVTLKAPVEECDCDEEGEVANPAGEIESFL